MISGFPDNYRVPLQVRKEGRVLSKSFLIDFKRVTEARWREISVDPHAYGFQFQAGTRWLPGLSDDQIATYEDALRLAFPHDFRELLRFINGTDLPTINVYGHCGEPHRQSVGVYSYARDLLVVRELMERVQAEQDVLVTTMEEQGFELPARAKLLPIYAHRYLVCLPDRESSAVLSIESGEDAILYGDSLQKYLEREFLR